MIMKNSSDEPAKQPAHISLWDKYPREKYNIIPLAGDGTTPQEFEEGYETPHEGVFVVMPKNGLPCGDNHVILTADENVRRRDNWIIKDLQFDRIGVSSLKEIISFK